MVQYAPEQSPFCALYHCIFTANPQYKFYDLHFSSEGRVGPQVSLTPSACPLLHTQDSLASLSNTCKQTTRLETFPITGVHLPYGEGTSRVHKHVTGCGQNSWAEHLAFFLAQFFSVHKFPFLGFFHLAPGLVPWGHSEPKQIFT